MARAVAAGLLSGRNILVTAGPMRAWLDPVRYLSNLSTGELGGRIAMEAARLGGRVFLIHGRGSWLPVARPRGRHREGSIRRLEITTIEDLARSIREAARERDWDAIVHAMAVLDYVPSRTRAGKIPSGRRALSLKLVPTPKIIERMRKMWPDATLVGFKLGAGLSRGKLLRIARDLQRRSGADIVVANDLGEMEGRRHVGHILGEGGMLLATRRTRAGIARALVRIVAGEPGAKGRRGSSG